MAALSFHELVPGSSITRYYGEMYDGVETVMVITGKSRKVALKDIGRISDEIFNSTKLVPFKLPGEGNHKTYTVHITNLVEFIMILPGKVARAYRQKFADIVTRYLAGDASMHAEIQANAISDAPIHQMAREACAAGSPLSTDYDTSLKRKRDELETMRLEMDMKYTAIRQYQTLCTDSSMDERAKILFKDSLLNSTVIAGRITNGDNEDLIPISLSQMGAKLGYRLTTDEYKKVGKIASKLYKDEYGTTPPKHTQLVNGQAIHVNTYFAKHEELVKKALDQYSRQGGLDARGA